jgi:hypothetical protein
MPKKNEKVEKVFIYLCEIERNSTTFTPAELASYSGLKLNSVKTYITKRWTTFLVPEGGGAHRPIGMLKLGLDNFQRIHSQKFLGEEPLRPRFGDEVDLLIDKAREAALLAVSIYNNPVLKHRSYGYMVQIVIAWTALFHALFEKRRVCYFYKEGDGKFKMIDGDKKAWELSKCISEFWKGASSAVAKNLEFLIGLRNKIEHRSLPAVDLVVAGECQSSLTNFENFLTDEFGDYFSLDASLAISLQLSRISSKSQVRALKQLQTHQYEVVRQYIETYRNGLPTDILNSQEFRLSVVMIPKVVNRASAADFCIEFKHVQDGEPVDPNARIVLIREKLGDKSRFRHTPGVVVEQVKKRAGVLFTLNLHSNAWKYFKVRPPSSSKDKTSEMKFCSWVEGAEKYLYTDEWIELLVKETTKSEVYEAIKGWRG